MDVIFEKLIPTWIEEPSCNKCRQQLTICISYNTNNAGECLYYIDYLMSFKLNTIFKIDYISNLTAQFKNINHIIDL